MQAYVRENPKKRGGKTMVELEKDFFTEYYENYKVLSFSLKPYKTILPSTFSLFSLST